MADEEKELDSDDTEKEKELTVPITELRKVRAEAAKYRKELQELKAKAEAETEKAKMESLSEAEKAKALLEKAESDNKKLRESIERTGAESVIIAFASKMGFTDPSDVVRMIDLESVRDEKGSVDQDKIEVAVKKLSEEKPYLRSSSPKLPDYQQAIKDGMKPQLTNQNDIDAMKLQAKELLKQGRVGEYTRLCNKAWEMQFGEKTP